MMAGNFFGGAVFGGGFFGAGGKKIDVGGRVRIQRERERAADEELVKMIQMIAPDVFDYFDNQQ